MEKIYIITAGNYSDYHIVRISDKINNMINSK